MKSILGPMNILGMIGLKINRMSIKKKSPN